MKEGAEIGEGPGDDPFAEDESDTSADAGRDDAQTNGRAGESDATQKPPYAYRRDRVLEGREHHHFPLRDDTADDVEELIDEMNDRFDQHVNNSDVKEALVLVALDDPDAVEAKLRSHDIGIDWEWE